MSRPPRPSSSLSTAITGKQRHQQQQQQIVLYFFFKVIAAKISSKFFFSFFFFSFQCIQACDYDETKLVTGENLIRHRSTKFAHLSLKHISLIGVVRVKLTTTRKKSSNELVSDLSDPKNKVQLHFCLMRLR